MKRWRYIAAVNVSATARSDPPTIEANLPLLDPTAARHDRHTLCAAFTAAQRSEKADSLEQLRAQGLARAGDFTQPLCEKNEKFIENTEVLFTKRDFRVTISFGLNRARR